MQAICQDKTVSRAKSKSSSAILLFAAVVPFCLSVWFSIVDLAKADELERAAKIKAAFVYYACMFVSSSNGVNSSNASITVCGIGDDKVSSELRDLLQNKKLKNRVVNYLMFDEKTIAERPESLLNCDIAYISEGIASTKQVGDLGTRNDVLTISEYAAFLSQGGIIKMFSESNRIRFDVNANNADNAGIRFSAEFLALANKVISKK